MSLLVLIARLATLVSAMSVLATGLAVLVGEARVRRSEPVARRGGPLALVNFAGIAGFGIVGTACAATEWGSLQALPGELLIRPAGVFCLAAAGIMAMTGIRTMGRYMASRAEVREDTPLLMSGPFGIVRHPLYLSILLLWLGGTLALLSVPLAAGFAAFVPLFVARARQEEELLIDHFGGAYDAYRSGVPMLLPWPRPNAR